jgi:hypothetical protein
VSDVASTVTLPDGDFTERRQSITPC